MAGYFAEEFDLAVEQPQDPLRVRQELRPLYGLQPGGFGRLDTSGVPLTAGSGVSSVVSRQGRIISLTDDTNGYLRNLAVSANYPLSFVFAGSMPFTVDFRCPSMLATASDKTVRFFGKSDGSVVAQHIGGTTSATATSAQIFNFGEQFTAVAVFGSATDVRVYGAGPVSRSSASSSTNVGALVPLTRLAYGQYNGSVALYPWGGNIALAQWLNVSLTAAEAWAIVYNPGQIYESPPIDIWVPSTGGATLALSGVAATGAAGALAPTITNALAGVAATGAVGTLTPTVGVTVALTGAAATGATGSLAPSMSVALSGAAATGAVGTLTPTVGVTVALTGAAATGAVGLLVPSIIAALAGAAATGAVGVLTPVTGTTVALTGAVGTGATGSLAPAFSLSITGAAATGAAGTLTPVSGTTVALAGVSGASAVGLLVPGFSLSVAGVSATGAAGVLVPGFGLSVSGVSATGAVGTLSPSTGTFVALTGVASTGQYGSLAPSFALNLSGILATGYAGALSPPLSGGVIRPQELFVEHGFSEVFAETGRRETFVEAP